MDVFAHNMSRTLQDFCGFVFCEDSSAQTAIVTRNYKVKIVDWLRLLQTLVRSRCTIGLLRGSIKSDMHPADHGILVKVVKRCMWTSALNALSIIKSLRLRTLTACARVVLATACIRLDATEVVQVP